MLIFTSAKGFSNNAKGYIVTLNNDTVFVQIKVPGGFFFGIGSYNIYKKVEVVDSIGDIKILIPKEIKAYGYTYKSKEYVYRVKPVKDGSYYFLEPVIVGPHTSLYQYLWTGGNGQNLNTIYEFTFENPDGNYLFLPSTESPDAFKTSLKIFYKENFKIQQLIDQKFKTRKNIQKDIREIVEAANNS